MGVTHNSASQIRRHLGLLCPCCTSLWMLKPRTWFALLVGHQQLMQHLGRIGHEAFEHPLTFTVIINVVGWRHVTLLYSQASGCVMSRASA